VTDKTMLKKHAQARAQGVDPFAVYAMLENGRAEVDGSATAETDELLEEISSLRGHVADLEFEHRESAA
jgi:hypothetical protein